MSTSTPSSISGVGFFVETVQAVNGKARLGVPVESHRLTSLDVGPHSVLRREERTKLTAACSRSLVVRNL